MAMQGGGKGRRNEGRTDAVADGPLALAMMAASTFTDALYVEGLHRLQELRDEGILNDVEVAREREILAQQSRERRALAAEHVAGAASGAAAGVAAGAAAGVSRSAAALLEAQNEQLRKEILTMRQALGARDADNARLRAQVKAQAENQRLMLQELEQMTVDWRRCQKTRAEL